MTQSRFEANAKQLLQQSEALDESTLAELHQARVNALNSAPQVRRKPQFLPFYLTAAALATLLIVVLLPTSPEPAPARLMADIDNEEYESIISEEELYENLDFYLWLAGEEYDS